MSEGNSDSQNNYKHPIIAKHSTNKLPEGFMKTKGTVIVPKKLQKEKIKEQMSANPSSVGSSNTQKRQTDNKEAVKKKRESRNPFLSVKNVGKEIERLLGDARAMQEEMSIHNVNLHISKRHQQPSKAPSRKIRYEDFITLSVVSKKETSALKKSLHIPSLTVYYMRECLINMSIDKAELMEWIENCNRSEHQGKIVEVFWNMPESSYSLLYEYQEGLLMEKMLANLNTLPLDVIRDIAIFHFTSNPSVYNSQLIINTASQSQRDAKESLPEIYYMPIYEETPPLIRSEKLQEVMQDQVEADSNDDDGTGLDRKIIWRLGVLLLVSFVGQDFLRSDLLSLQTPLSKCCLLHSLLEVPHSLIKLYFEENDFYSEAQHLISFLCHLLSSNSDSPTYTRSLKELKRHKFLTSMGPTPLVTLQELIETVTTIEEDYDPQHVIDGSEHKLHNVMNVIGLNLNNIEEEIEIDFKPQNNPNISYVATELGMKQEVDKVAKCLENLYLKEAKSVKFKR